ncbi:MAG: hypothetical protein RL260_3415, partial [Pseudomonadota bacterium]
MSNFHVIIPSTILLILVLAFVRWFFVPAVLSWMALNKVKVRLQGFPSQPAPKDLEKVFAD